MTRFAHIRFKPDNLPWALTALLLLLTLVLSSCAAPGGVEREGFDGDDTTVTDKDHAFAELEDVYWRQYATEWETYMKGVVTHGKKVPVTSILAFTDRYFDAKEVIYRTDIMAYEDKYDRYRKGKLRREPKRPVKDFTILIKYFRLLEKRYRNEFGGDAFRYSLAYAYGEMEREKQSMRIYEGLLKDYPKSPYASEVNFRLAEYYFVGEHMARAEEAYLRALENPKSEFYDKSLYKLGWVYYKIDELGKSVDSFISVVDMHWDGRDKEGEDWGLMQESLSGIVMSLNRTNDIPQAIAFMRSKGKSGYAHTVYNRFADLLNSEARYEGAIKVYNSLIVDFPDSPGLVDVYRRIAETYVTIGKKGKATTAKLHMIRAFNPGTAWYKKHYPERSEEVDKVLKEAMLSLSNLYHRKGKEAVKPLKKEKRINTAIEVYRLFLASFPGTKEYKDVNLLVAEALFDVKKYSDSALEYENAMGFFPEGKKRGEIAYTALTTHELIFHAADSTAAGKEERRKRIDGAVRVIENYGPEMELNGTLEKSRDKVADMYADTGEFEQARLMLAPLLKSKKSRMGLVARKKTSEFLLAENKFIEAEASYAIFARMSSNPGIKKKLATLRYKIAEEDLEAGRYDEAVKRFEIASKTLPGSEVGEASLIKLAQIFIATKKIDRGFTNAVKRIEREYPRSTAPISLLVDAGRLVEVSEPLKAANLYAQAAETIQWLFKQGIWRRGEGPKKLADSTKLLFASALIYEEHGETRKTESIYRELIASKRLSGEVEIETVYKLGMMQINSGRKKQGLVTLTAIARRKPRATGYFAARSRLLLLNQRLDDYLKIRLRLPFEQSLKKKTDMLDSLFTGYTSIVNENVPEIIPEVFFYMGLCLENYRDSLLNSERPGGLNEEELEEYMFVIEETAYPFEERSVSAYEKSLSSGAAQKVFDEWTDKSIERLSVLKPALYKRPFGSSVPEAVFVNEPAVREDAPSPATTDKDKKGGERP